MPARPARRPSSAPRSPTAAGRRCSPRVPDRARPRCWSSASSRRSSRQVAVGSILTLTFTDKAAAELRERIRSALRGAHEPEHARAVDAAWIGTIHGFCARVLRSRPLAAGLDPRFTVLDEAAARRLAAAAFESALEQWTAARRPAVDLAAAYGRELEPMVTRAYATLRSRGRPGPAQLPLERRRRIHRARAAAARAPPPASA